MPRFKGSTKKLDGGAREMSGSYPDGVNQREFDRAHREWEDPDSQQEEEQEQEEEEEEQ